MQFQNRRTDHFLGAADEPVHAVESPPDSFLVNPAAAGDLNLAFIANIHTEYIPGGFLRPVEQRFIGGQ